jgi:pyridoxal phosphate enzyme (YggS family)
VHAAGPAELMVVTKGVAAEQIATVVDAGCTLFGENRVQELEAKRAAVAALRPTANLTWVLIGPLQSNKVRRAMEVAERIATVGSVDLLERIAALATDRAKPIEIALQVNVDEDPAKSGFTPEGLRAALPAIAAIVKGAPVTLAGLFTVGRLTAGGEAARPTFAQFRTLAAQVDTDAQALGLNLGPLRSAGMSGDFEVAISEGSTEVRLGSALFGPRG